MVLVGLRYGLFIIYEYVYDLLFHVYLGTLVPNIYIYASKHTHTYKNAVARIHFQYLKYGRRMSGWL